MRAEPAAGGVGALAGTLMLDLTDDGGAICGKMFADLGADVIKVEPPAGCPTRRIPPFLDDEPGADRSLFFLAYEMGKRSVTANLEMRDGRTLFRELVRRADFVVESFPAGYLDGLGLGYDELAQVNPRLIHATVTPFGDRGPGRDWKAHDIQVWAAGGMMFLMGVPDRPPVQLSVPQAMLHGGAEAAVASFLAHFARQQTGAGQHVVIDAQACVVWTLMNEQAFPLLHGDYLRRNGVYSGSRAVARQTVYRCADGFVTSSLTGGTATFAESTGKLIAWMDEEGYAPPWFTETDWAALSPAQFGAGPDEEFMKAVRRGEAQVQSFFMTMSRREIYRQALKRRILLAPVATTSDLAEDEQLQFREYFQAVEHEYLGRELTVPGPWVRLEAGPLSPPRPAPRLGADNLDVYGGLLGYPKQKIADLYSVGAI